MYLTTIRPVLESEYAVPVWEAIPDYLSEWLESIQRRALRIIFPSVDDYDDGTDTAVRYQHWRVDARTVMYKIYD